MSYIKIEDGHVYDESKTVLSTLLGTRVIQVSDEIEPLLEDFIVKDGTGKTTVRIHFDEEECEYLYQRPNGTAWVGLGNGEQFYGAVWQGMNLISVARLNKGEWNLL